MANQANEAVTPQPKFSFYTTSTGGILVFPAIEDFALIPGAQEILAEVNIQGGSPQGLLAYDVLATAIALKTGKKETFPIDVEAKLQTLSDSLVSTDALVAAWELVQESHITDQATELLDVPAERADLISQIIANNPADFVSTEVATEEAGEMTVTFVAGTAAATEPETTTEEVVETTTEEVAELTPEEEAAVETRDSETGIIAESTPDTSALAHFDANAENGIVITDSNVNKFMDTLADAARTNALNAETVKTIAETQASAQRTIELLANAVAKPAEKVTMDAEVVTETPAQA